MALDQCLPGLIRNQTTDSLSMHIRSIWLHMKNMA